MVQPGDASSSVERNRRRRRQMFLDAALAVVATEGVAALTMQRVTQEIGSAEGTIYQYFRSREALMGELQQLALSRLGEILLETQAALDERLSAARATPRLAALARLYSAGLVWIEAETSLPREIELCRRLFTHPGVFLSKAEAEGTVLPVAVGLLGYAGSLLDDAVAAKALSAGDSLERAIVVLAGTTGVLMSADLDRWEPRLSSAPLFAVRMFRQLLVGWGAREADLARCEPFLEGKAIRPS